MVEVDPWRGLRETRGLRELRYDGGSLALNLVCTVGRRGSRPIERLTGPAELGAWLTEVGLAEDGSTPLAASARFLTELRELREALYAFLAATADGGVAPEESRRLINERAAIAPPSPLVCGPSDATSDMSVRWAGDLHGAAVLSLLARDGIDHLIDPWRRERLSTCAAPDCRMLFLDASRGKRRQWCSMQRCGNRVKAASHRARAKAG